MNVHVFDGKLPPCEVSKLSKEEKRKAFERFEARLCSQRAKHIIRLIVSDMFRTDGRNFDEKSNVDCTDILIRICELSEKEVEPFVEEQIADIDKGLCAQGRTVRLWQCLQALL